MIPIPIPSLKQRMSTVANAIASRTSVSATVSSTEAIHLLASIKVKSLIQKIHFSFSL